MKNTRPVSRPSRRLSLAAAVAAVIASAPAVFAQTSGAFTVASNLGTGNSDALVGLSSTTKTYLGAYNLGEATNLTINGVLFTGIAGANPTAAGVFSTTGLGVVFGGGGTNPAGVLGSLTNRFVYGTAGTAEVYTYSNLTVGQTYVVTFYNRSWESGAINGGLGRTQNLSAGNASVASLAYDPDAGATAQGSLNLLRYTFQAASATQTISFLNANAPLNGTNHNYGFTLEQTFNNSWTGGANWTSSTWTGGAAVAPNAAGSNANFAAQGSPTTIDLDANRAVGHIQFAGTNAWTISSTGGNTLTLQADLGGAATLSALAGSHTIAPNITLASPNLLKLGAGAISLPGNITAGASTVQVGGGTLTLGGTNTYTGETIIGNGTLEVKTVSDYGAPSAIGARAFAQENGTITGVGLHIQGGTLKFTGTTPQTTNRNIRILNGAAGATIDASGAAGATLGFTHTGANINLFDTAGTRTLTLTGSNTDDNTFAIQLTNQAANATNLTKAGAGTWALTGPDANTATGTTTVTNGVLRLNKTGVNAVGGALSIGNGSTPAVVHLGGTGGNQIVDTGVVTLAGTGATAGSLRMNNLSETVGGLASTGGAGIVENESGSAGTGTLSVNVASGSQNFSGALRDGNGIGTDGTLAFTKLGAGTQILSGANTHSGATTVSGGTLQVDGSISAASAVGVTGGTLGGTGTVSGTVTVNATGHISPATATTPGTLTIGALSLGSGSLVDLEFGGTSDLVNITGAGALAIGGGAFNLFAAGGVTPLTTNGIYTLLDYNTSFSGALSSLGVANAQVGKFYAINDDAANTLIKLTIADAVTTQWNGLAGDGLWGTNANWSALAANSPGTLAKFGAAGSPVNVAVNGPKTVGSIEFNEPGGYTISGSGVNAITFDNGIATPGISVLTGNHIIAAPVILLGNLTATTASGTSLKISGAISGAKSFSAAGTGTTILSGANSYTTTNVVNGTLQIGDGGSAGTLGSGEATLAAGATLDFNRGDTALNVANNLLGASGQVTLSGSGTVTLSGANTFGTTAGGLAVNAGTLKVGSATAIPAAVLLTLNSTLDLNQNNVSVGSLSGGASGIITDNGTGGLTTTFTVNQAGNTSFDGSILDGADRLLALTKAGAGTLTLGGTSVNSYFGGTTITGGSLTLAKTGVNAIVGNVQIGDAVGSDFLQLAAFDQIADMSVLTFTAAGSGNSAFFHLNGFSETVRGIQTTVAQAAVIANGTASGTSVLTVDTAGGDFTYDGIIRNGVAGGTIGITKAGPGTLTLANTAKVAATNYTGDTFVSDGKLVLSNLDVFTSPITINSGVADALTFNQASKDLALATTISGAGALTKDGANTLTLTAANNGFNGLITLNAGTLGIGNAAALGNGPITITGGIFRASGAARFVANLTTATSSFTLGRATHFTNPVTLGANVTITGNNFDGPANTDSRFDGGIQGPFAVTFAEGPQLLGTGALVINGISTNSGGTTVASGRVTVTAVGALANAPLAVNAGILNLNNAVQDVTSFSGAGGVVNLGGGGILKTTQTVDTSYAGVLQGAGGFTKAGRGKLTLSGANIYSGDTNVDDGALIVTGTLTGSIVNVNTATAIVRFATSQTLPALNIADGATVILSAVPPPAPEDGFGAPGGDLAGGPVQAVPEPGAAALLLGGLATILSRRRRR